ncbi:MAG: DUF938 domain-containing protein [Phormidesmis sp.]
MSDARQYAPATERNRQPILDVLRQALPATGTVLEISSGTGEHITFFAPRLLHLQWIASEPDALLRKSIQAWGEVLPTQNLRLPPLDLDVSRSPWPVERLIPGLRQPITAIVNINMIHISAWDMCQHLMAGAERILPSEGVLYLYGPFKREGVHTSPSNEAFDQMLRERNPAWGIRDLAAVSEIARQHSLQLENVVAMPANNFSVTFRRYPSPA